MLFFLVFLCVGKAVNGGQDRNGFRKQPKVVRIWLGSVPSQDFVLSSGLMSNSFISS